jgi:SAM-dependent methyltransferase
VATPFFSGGEQPLATLGWPKSSTEAMEMDRLPLDFVQCPACTHVYNRSFMYDMVPYQKNPNRMFNTGKIWKWHLAETIQLLSKDLPEHPHVVDIGCGEGHFIRGLSEGFKGGRFIGFDPNTSAESGHGVEYYARLFEPFEDVITFAPDLLIVRHVLEHFTELAGLLEPLAWSASQQDKPCWLFAEVPCIDRVFETDRLSDFYYEHVSHFTIRSFITLLQRLGELRTLGHGYNGEVVYGLVSLDASESMKRVANQSTTFFERSMCSVERISQQLSDLAQSGASIAIWGGTGKAAAFMHQFGVDAKRFPLVVDSDPDKAGTFVPGTGQKIMFRDVLKTVAVDVLIIPAQWRAKDIVAEMNLEGIEPGKILIEHAGQLADFESNSHPYR